MAGCFRLALPTGTRADDGRVRQQQRQHLLPLFREVLHKVSADAIQELMKFAKSGLREFEKIAARGWDDGLSLDQLLSRVNQAASKLLPGLPTTTDSRINPTLVPRTFRHYVTLGCIEPGRREGRRAVYGYRHFLQALLVRRLLWERVPADRIAALVARRSIKETEGMFLYGVEYVARSEDGDLEQPGAATGPVEKWNRVRVMPGVELHLNTDLPRLKPADLRRLLELLEKALREVLPKK